MDFGPWIGSRDATATNYWTNTANLGDLQLRSGDGQVDAAKESFLMAASRQINEHGYRGASVDRISAALNVTKGAFYHHNEAKDDLVAACFRRSFGIAREAQQALHHHLHLLLARLAGAHHHGIHVVHRPMVPSRQWRSGLIPVKAFRGPSA